MNKYRALIEKYVSNLSMDDIKNLASNNNISLKEYEIKNIYYEIKNNLNLWFEDTLGRFSKIKDKLEPTTYLKLSELLDKYKNYL